LNQKLEEANKSKDILFSVVSHDMKNPLTSVSGFIQLLKRDWETLSEEKKMEYFRLLDVSVENLTDLTEDLLQWSRAQSSKIVYEPRDILLKELANDIVQLYRPVAEKKGLQLEVEGEEQLLVSADINMLQTIFRNLISNAIKFSRVGGSILTSIYKSGDKVCVAIKDQGVGIPEEKLNQLFHIDKTFTTPGTDGELGTGLGLVLVSEFMELNQGSIELESQEGQGTTFTLSFPASGDKS